ncbi:hypothetical protein SCLCIDRAFT_1224842 [Scleroderma citrinum Foug A]|uniref:Uncharacterized protein n=1 Tax=Scleroderma citrinum Foug A TaxID=1036808 RepID=A0A0C3D4Y3_9AGAM|nr:hypothetical protein SCLCIDRAFT_1224842 [Scleroderma citrinum Foug A]
MYPHDSIWLIGRPLWGSVASLIDGTFGVAVVAFEAPAEKLEATRLHFSSPPSTQHVMHTIDPIAMGTRSGITSTCAITGYATRVTLS